MSFGACPVVLQDLITLFAWKLPFEKVDRQLSAVLTIKDAKLPNMFFSRLLWNWRERRNMVNPVLVFCPVEDMSSIFNKFILLELLWCLDFRKRNVRAFGNRDFWRNSFGDHWQNIVTFGMFYNGLRASKRNIWTPTYNAEIKTAGHRFY